MVVELEPGISFDDAIIAQVSASEHAACRVSITRDGIVATEPDEFRDEWGYVDPTSWRERTTHSLARPEVLMLALP